MKVAFATQDQQRVDAHFGWAKHLAVYDVTPRATLRAGLRLRRRPGRGRQRGQAAPKLDAIADCAIVYVAAIGGSAAARVVAAKIHPIKVAQPEPILDILDKLQAVLAGHAAALAAQGAAEGPAADLRLRVRRRGEVMSADPGTADRGRRQRPAAGPFVLELIKQIRAQDTHGTWEGKSDAKLLEPYILTPSSAARCP
jgi:nitrogen fixation protein NifX